MFSYIFMKILEGRPRRYDRGINLLTAGHAGRVIDWIVENHVRPGVALLDVGCGTGSLALKAAAAGARVVGIDISEPMLAVARQRASATPAGGRVEFRHADVLETDELFAAGRFDLVTATLLFSELYDEQRQWALREFRRVLKPGGQLVIAAEILPQGWLQRLLYRLVRWPLALITYAVSQTVTRPVKELPAELERAGFEVVDRRSSLFGSFVTLCARDAGRKAAVAVPAPLGPEADKSALRTLLDFCGRWFPNPVEPGLRAIGHPGRMAPVLVTANFHLSVRRVQRRLAGRNAYLLVAPTGGINVWCASASGEMNTHSVIAVLKTSGVGDLVDHCRLVLPQFAAAGIDLDLLARCTGWHGLWGPADARHLPAFLDAGGRKSPEQCRARFPLGFRLEMLLSMNVPLWAVLAAAALIIDPIWALVISAVYWAAGLVLYGAYPLLPFAGGWPKALLVSAAAAAAMAAVSLRTAGSPFGHAGWMAVVSAAILAIGFDLKGIVGDRTSEAELLLHKLGVPSLGHLFRAQGVRRGIIAQDRSLCVNCGTCRLVCPAGVFSAAADGRSVAVGDPSACLGCGACVRQCAAGALQLGGPGSPSGPPVQKSPARPHRT